MTRTPFNPELAPPSHDDGTPWPLVCLYGPDHAWAADTAGELCGALIDGYDELPEGVAGEPAALQLRYLHAVTVANQVQQIITAKDTQDGRLDVNALDEEDLTVLFSDRANPLDITFWSMKTPLVVITTDYAPFTERTPPDGNLIWIDPAQELAYLRSLVEVGLIELYEHSETPAQG